ncbi:hypothetical protein Golob_026177, partial [Gossypium lobatum]|nr:hypothetical protein [Gossypium lobatum]
MGEDQGICWFRYLCSRSQTSYRKGDSLGKGYVLELWDFTRISETQNSLQELKKIWDHCFTSGKVDLVPTVEEYRALLWCLKIQVDRVYSKAVNVLTFLKKLMNITGMTHPNTKKVNVFALSIYGLVVFPKALGHVDEAAIDLFDRLDRRVTPVLTILVETFRSLNACWK